MKTLNIITFLVAMVVSAFAQNPVIQTKFTADPAPLVYHDTVFLYTGHDEDDAFGFKMHDWLLYTSTDMVNWTDHGAIASVKDFKWAGVDNGAWASQCINRNGKFYLYCSMPNNKGIGVLVADSPYGPFKDPIGKALIHNSSDDIDPTVFVDDDGQAYLYWGNPNMYYIKLNQDMVSYSGEIVKDPSIAKVKSKPDPFHYQEGPWAFKRDGKYYMAYASTCCPEGIGYAMSSSATGPWEYKGSIMDGDPRSSGNHPGIINYKGTWYVFGFNYNIMMQTVSKHYERRSVSIEELTFNPDGTIKHLPFWSVTGVKQRGNVNPYTKVEAETIAYSEGLKTDNVTEWERNVSWDKGKKKAERVFVSSINNGDYLKVQGVNFTSGASAIEVCTAGLRGGKMEVRIDKLDGPLLGTVNITDVAKGDMFSTVQTPLKGTKGVHDVYFVFKGEKDLFYFDWWKVIPGK